MCCKGKFSLRTKNTVTRSEYDIQLNTLRSFPFVYFLGIWKPILKEINDLKVYLQTEGTNLQRCDIEIGASVLKNKASK